MRQALWFSAAAVSMCAAAAPASADESPKYGGTLTNMIPAESPPSFDAQCEETFATIHFAAPFYSTLVRINPYNPNSATNIVCDLCADMPEPSAAATPSYFREEMARC